MLKKWRWVIITALVLSAVIAYAAVSRTSSGFVLLLLFGAVAAFLAAVDARTNFIMGRP